MFVSQLTVGCVTSSARDLIVSQSAIESDTPSNRNFAVSQSATDCVTSSNHDLTVSQSATTRAMSSSRDCDEATTTIACCERIATDRRYVSRHVSTCQEATKANKELYISNNANNAREFNKLVAPELCYYSHAVRIEDIAHSRAGLRDNNIINMRASSWQDTTATTTTTTSHVGSCSQYLKVLVLVCLLVGVCAHLPGMPEHHNNIGKYSHTYIYMLNMSISSKAYACKDELTDQSKQTTNYN